MTDKHIKLDGRSIPIEQAIKIGLISEKDINVPSKQEIMYDYNAKDCEQCNSDSICCYCKNLACYKLEEQLKAKEQENKDLREDIKDIANLLDLDTGEEYNFGNIELEIKQLKAKEQECEELKRQHRGDKGLITSTGKMNYQLIQEYDKLKTALAEIKEIAEKNLNIHTCAFKGCAYDLITKQILQKISECEENNEN